MRVINHELMPLLGECYEQASERDPRLKGMLALAVKVADAEGIGGIIEDVEAAPGNEVPDADLVECIRQSAFTIELPTPSQTARNGLQLTVPLGIQLEAGAGQ